MERSRAARRERLRSRHKQLAVIVVLAACLLAVAGAALAYSRSAGTKPPSVASQASTTASAPVVPESDPPTATPVEVPDVRGRTLTEAELVLTTAGFEVASTGASTTPDGRPTTVTFESPVPGTRLLQGGRISLRLAAMTAERTRPILVVIDPGHQSKPDLSPEPLGPGSQEMKEKVTAGASGVRTGRQECQVALEIAMRLKTHLEASGMQVLLTRTSNGVNMSNVARAQVANRAAADLFVRLHADAATSASATGVTVLYPSGNTWISPIEARSAKAASAVDKALAAATRARDGGVAGRSDLSGFNWSKVPTILVEAGFLSNADDDARLADAGYQDKVATGITAGITAYFGK